MFDSQLSYAEKKKQSVSYTCAAQMSENYFGRQAYSSYEAP